ncbi:uncharacterized protein LOC122497698 [Leptopilina heterotoma]|uniref:uncharacterized protein LOC122497698 n=1 Tax=Leptopilina heterotoma TaxID=63436 RepID=UPI001CA82E6D|nr:uncharacterized protein LOC122497698 [Leptopilina heterotoma]
MVETRSGSNTNKSDKCESPRTMSFNQQAMDELKEELARISKQRIEAEKENTVLRQEILRFKDIVEHMKNNSEGGNKVDSSIQTEEIEVFKEKTNFVNQNVIDQTTHDDNFENKKILQPGNQCNAYENRKSIDSSNQSCINIGGCRNDKQDILVTGLMNYFQSMQVTTPLPKFDGIKLNPIEFIKQLEKYFVRKNVSDDAKLLMVEDAMIGRAKLWYDARVFPFITYSHFKDKFLEEFYSIEARMVAKSKWENRRFKDSDQSLQAYYVEQLRDAKFCLTSLQEYEVNYLIVKQLPQRAREVLATIDYMDTSKISQTLSRLDVTRGDAEIGVPSRSHSNSNFSEKSNNCKNQFGQARQGYDRSESHNDEKRGNVNSAKAGPEDNDRSRNWRHRPVNNNPQYYREQQRDKISENNQIREKNNINDNNPGSSVRVINKSNMSEFLEDLCWDVEPTKKNVCRKFRNENS